MIEPVIKDVKVGRPLGRLDSKPRKKILTKAQRSAAAKKANETRRLMKEQKESQLQGLQTGTQPATGAANREFEELLDEGAGQPGKQTAYSPLEGQAGPQLLSPCDISEWIGWPFMLWADQNNLADLCLSDAEKKSLAEPLCRIANRHNLSQYVNPDILDGITAAGRLTPIMIKRFSAIAAERKKRAAHGGAADPQAKAGEGSPADVTTQDTENRT